MHHEDRDRSKQIALTPFGISLSYLNPPYSDRTYHESLGENGRI